MSAVSQCLKNLTTSQLKCKLRKTDWVGSLWCELEQLITIHTTSRPANLTATFISRHVFFLSFFFFFNPVFLRGQVSLYPAEKSSGPTVLCRHSQGSELLSWLYSGKGAKEPFPSADTSYWIFTFKWQHFKWQSIFLKQSHKFFTKIRIQSILLLQQNKHLPKKDI